MDHSGDPHWNRDDQTGCWIYNPYPQSDEAVAWEGPSCFGNEASGVGTVTWFLHGSWVIAEKGEMIAGKMNGPWIRRFSNGQSYDAYFVDGVEQQNTADEGGDSADQSGSSDSYSPVYNGDAYMETLKRQNRENCERAAQGANIICNPE
jgi:hypothetical protein